MIKPLTMTIHAIGFSSILLGRDHCTSKYDMLNISRICLALLLAVLCPPAVGGLGYAEHDAQFAWGGVRRLAAVEQKVDLAERIHDSAGPDLFFAARQGRRPLARQRRRQLAAQLGKFLVNVIAADGIGEASDFVIDGLHLLWDRLAILFGHVRILFAWLRLGSGIILVRNVDWK